MSERHGGSSAQRRASVSGTDGARSELFFWVRSELFEYGLLPMSPHSDISFASLLAIVRKYRFTHELNAQYLKAINTLYSTNTSAENVSMRYVLLNSLLKLLLFRYQGAFPHYCSPKKGRRLKCH